MIQRSACCASVPSHGSELEYACLCSFLSLQEQLKELFEADCGPTTRIKILEGKGIAFITFESEEGAAKAVEFNQTEYEGRTLRINLSADRQQGDRGKGDGKGTSPREDKIKAEPCNQIVLRNLSFDTTEETIRETFGDCGRPRCRGIGLAHVGLLSSIFFEPSYAYLCHCFPLV